MSDLHIDEFFADAAKTILALYRVFPRPIVLYVEDICGPDEPDEYGVHSVRHQACFAAMLWLGAEGYIRYVDVVRQEAIDQAVLTGRCFTALQGEAHVTPPDEDGLPPSVRKHRARVIFALERAVAGKSSAAIEDALQPLLQRISSPRRGTS